jgi:hypothetical protein
MSFAHTAFVTLVAALAASATEEPSELRTARRDFEAHPTEAARVQYITKLVRLREKILAAHRDGWEAIDAEIIRHPMPGAADSRLLVGQWASPRHLYLYRADGTWTMDDEGLDLSVATHGTWRIKGNTYFQAFSGDSRSERHTIIILTTEYFVFDGYILRRGTQFHDI